jgi:polyphosphate kinase 2 (PPK2 family)
MAKIDLADFEAHEKIKDEAYSAQIKALQFQLHTLQSAYLTQGLRGMVAVEGWDAGGKGGLISRLTAELDPRFVKVWSIGAPTKTELSHHYLWRFWSRLPGDRELAVFDRTWYGRVLVERVDKLTPERLWRRAYDEINDFEATQAASGTRIAKLFLHISADEQDKRLRERLEVPYKRWKTGFDDYHNRSQRSAYIDAYQEMFERCDTADAPWTVIAANSKKMARIKGLQAVIKTLEKGVDLSYPPLDPKLRETAEAALGLKVRD